MVAEPYKHLPRRGEQEQAQPGRLPRAAPGAQFCPSETSARCLVPLGAPTGEVALALKVLLSVGTTNLKNCVHLRLRT